MSTDLAEHCVDFGVRASKFVGKEVALRVSDELDQCHHDSPRMRAVAEHALKENLGDHLLERFVLNLGKEMKQ